MPYFPPAGGGSVLLPNTITDEILADMPDGTVKGRALGAGVGDPVNLTPAQLQAILAASTTARLVQWWIDAGAMVPAMVNLVGPIRVWAEQASGASGHEYLEFSPTADNYCFFKLRMPKSWNLGSLAFRPRWTGSAAGSGGVMWLLQTWASRDGDPLSVTAWGVATSLDTYIGANLDHEGPTTTASVPGGTVAAGNMITFRLSRQPADVNDTLAIPARLLGITLEFSVNAWSDA